MKGMTAKVERADWLRYPTEDFIFNIGDQKPLKKRGDTEKTDE